MIKQHYEPVVHYWLAKDVYACNAERVVAYTTTVKKVTCSRCLKKLKGNL